jgi:small subunit ribosomal protein S6
LAETGAKLYETIALFTPELDDEAMGERVKRMESVIGEHGGKMTSANRWKKRRLAFPVKKHEEGLYVVLRFVADKALLPDLDYLLRYDEQCLRYMVLDVARYPGMVRTKAKGEEK